MSMLAEYGKKWKGRAPALEYSDEILEVMLGNAWPVAPPSLGLMQFHHRFGATSSLSVNSGIPATT